MRIFKTVSIFFISLACILTLILTTDTTYSQLQPIYNEVIANYPKQTQAVNSVAAIYLNYRIFDTIFEALMLLVSVMGVVHFSRHMDKSHAIVHEARANKRQKRAELNYISLVIPCVIMIGIYIILNGHISPGGGFQGGAALASSLICVYLVRPDKAIRFYTYERNEKLVFISILTISMLFAVSNFYLNVPEWNTFYLIIMNILIGIKVYLGLSIIFFRFVHYEDK